MLAYIAQSTAAFAPLTQQQLPKAHRRKSSLSEARASLSPYGHPLARAPVHNGVSHFTQFATAPVFAAAQEGQPQKKRPSLQTKFERTNSATSSHFPTDDEAVSQPTSAIFAQFTRETPPTPPPSLMEIPSMSPFKMSTGYSPKEEVVKDMRPRVDSEVRRQKLGWGKRGNSDGPARVVAAMEPVPRIPLAFISNNRKIVREREADKENVRPYVLCSSVLMKLIDRNVSPTKKSVAKRGARKAPRMVSVPTGLRA